MTKLRQVVRATLDNVKIIPTKLLSTTISTYRHQLSSTTLIYSKRTFCYMTPLPFEADCVALAGFPNQKNSELASPLFPSLDLPISDAPLTCPLELNLRKLNTHEALLPKALEVVKILVPTWSEVQLAHVKLTRISGALTNSVYIIENASSLPFDGARKILLRIYGIGVDQFVNRDQEIEWLAKLSSCEIGAKLLGTFHNGRLEEFLDSVTLTHEDLVHPDVSRHIAKRMSDLHQITHQFPAPPGAKPELWSSIVKWLPLAKKEYPKLQHLNNSDCYSIDFEEVELKMKQLRQTLDRGGPLVFCHNDAQYGNILRLNTTGELVVVDFEYSGYNPWEYDIANHFCEWMANYHSDAPHRLDETCYPTPTEQRTFLRSYLEAYHGSCDEGQLDTFLREIQRYSLASNLMWGLWGVIQASTSGIEFDYLAYGTQRLHFFTRDFSTSI